jgi:hypothetical protein
MAKLKIYRIDGQDGPRLVRAATVTQAIAHVAKATLEGRLATQDDLFDAGKAGVEIEVAGAEAPMTVGEAIEVVG